MDEVEGEAPDAGSRDHVFIGLCKKSLIVSSTHCFWRLIGVMNRCQTPERLVRHPVIAEKREVGRE